MVSRLTTKTNGDWDFSSLEGKVYPALICHMCGKLATVTYTHLHGRYGYCEDCFIGNKYAALKSWVGKCPVCGNKKGGK